MLGEALSVGSAAVWAGAVVLFKKSDAVAPQAMNLFKNVLGVSLMGLALLITGDGIDPSRTPEDWGALLVSGVLGIAIADTLIFAALRELGAGLMAIVECTYAPTIVLLSVLWLGESVGPGFLVGATLVIGGVFGATYVRRRQKVAGRVKAVALGASGILLMALGIILAKPALERGTLIEVAFIRLAAGVLGQLVWILPSRKRRRFFAVFRPQAVWRTLIPGAVLGGFVAMIMWVGGMKYADASVAGVLGQLAVIFTLIFARVFLNEPLTMRRLASGLAAMVGAGIIVWY